MDRRGTLSVLALSVMLLVACDGDDTTTSQASAPRTSVTAADDGEGRGSTLPSTTPSQTEPASASTVTETASDTLPATSSPEPVSVTTAAARPSVPEGSGGTETGPLSSADVDIETDDGLVQIGDADVPESAAGFPLPDGVDLELASETGTDAGFSGTAPGTVTEIADFFRTSLPEAGYDITDERRPAGDENPTVVVFSFESAEQVGDVAVTNAPGGGTSVIVTIADR